MPATPMFVLSIELPHACSAEKFALNGAALIVVAFTKTFGTVQIVAPARSGRKHSASARMRTTLNLEMVRTPR